MARSSRPLLIASILTVVALAGLGAWLARPEPAPSEPPEDTEDTGLTRQQTEDLMRTIGYVQ